MVLVEWILALLGASDAGVRHYLGFLAVAGLLLVLLGFGIDFNKLSLHYFYRDRLVEAFMCTVARPFHAGPAASPEVRRNHSQMRLLDLHGGIDAAPPNEASAKSASGPAAAQPFRQYRLRSQVLDRVGFTKTPEPEGRLFPGAATAAPYHLYNTCLNLATDRDPTYRTRKSDIFLFSKLHCGSQATGYVDTGLYRSGETKAARAMTISGAAADSALGRETFFAQSFGATLFNIRLGQWLENPRYRAGKHAWRQETWVFWPAYFLREMAGMSDARHRLVRLSDGGHTGDNLGLIPLLQRRCRVILAMDAECDTDYGFASLMYAIQYAEVDLGIRIDIGLDELKPGDDGRVARHYAIGTIVYPPTDKLPQTCGHLVVMKASVHAGDHQTVLKYHQSHPVFPQETTVDQFFSEEQFEAYRTLGENIADGLVKDHAELAEGRIDKPEWPAGCPGAA
jgi:hypothetical protein